MKKKLVLIIMVILIIVHFTKNFVHYDLLLAGTFGLIVVGSFYILFSLPFIFGAISIIMLLCGRWKVWALFLRTHFTTSIGKSSYDEIRLSQGEINTISSFETQPTHRIQDIHANVRPTAHLNDHHRINPASGLPMAGSSSIDIGGNVFGTK